MPAAVPRDLQAQAPPLLMLVVITTVLYVAQVVLVPLAVAVLLTFLLAPAARRLERWHLGRVPSTLVVVLLSFSVLGATGYVAGSQALQLAGSLPEYKDNIRSKLQDLRGRPDGAIGRASEALKDLKSELSQAPPDASADSRSGDRDPIPVEVAPPRTTPLQFLSEMAGPLFAPLGMAGAVIVFTVLMLLNREDLRDRLIRLMGRGRINVTTQALEDAAHRVSRYLTAQLIVNASYGIPVGVALYFLGIPNAALWGLLAIVLRFIPYVGAWIAAIMPVALAFAIDDGWSLVLWTVAVFLALELVSNNIVEPWLYGASTGLSTIAVMFAAIFWTWLWGAVGLLLATPLTVCLAVMGRHIPQLRFFNILLGDEPVLAPEARFYQRLLALDHEEATELAEAYAQEQGVLRLCDEVLLPALNLAEEDRHRDALDERREAFIYDITRRVVEDLAEGEPDALATTGSAEVAIIAARDEADDLAALMLEKLADPAVLPVQVLSSRLAAEALLETLEATRPRVILISAVPPFALMHTVYLAKRLRRRFPDALLYAGLWETGGIGAKARDRLKAAGIDQAVDSLRDALDLLRYTAKPVDRPMQAPSRPADEAARLEALEALQLLDTEPEEAFDRVTRNLCRIFQVPIALMTLVDRNRQWWKSQVGLPPDLAAWRSTSRDVSVCGHVVANDAMLVVEDLSRDERFANNPLIRETGMRFYAGAPLRTATGKVVGSLCLIDMRPRHLPPRELALLQFIADLVMREVERRAPATRDAQAAPATPQTPA